MNTYESTYHSCSTTGPSAPPKQPPRITLPRVETDLGIALRDTTQEPMVDVGIPCDERPRRNRKWYQRLWRKLLS